MTIGFGKNTQHTAISITKISMMTLSIMTFRVMTHSIITFSITKFNIMILSIMIFSITAIRKMTSSITTLSRKTQKNDIQLYSINTVSI